MRRLCCCISTSEADCRISFRQVPTFGRDTIRRFHRNVSEMKRLAARDFEDVLQVRIGFSAIASTVRLTHYGWCIVFHPSLCRTTAWSSQCGCAALAVRALPLARTRQVASAHRRDARYFWQGDKGSGQSHSQLRLEYLSIICDQGVTPWSRSSTTAPRTAKLGQVKPTSRRHITSAWTTAQGVQPSNLQVTHLGGLPVTD